MSLTAAEMKTIAFTTFGVVATATVAYLGGGAKYIHKHHHHHRHHHHVIGTAATAAIAILIAAMQLKGDNQKLALKCALIPTGIAFAGMAVVFLEAHVLVVSALAIGAFAVIALKNRN